MFFLSVHVPTLVIVLIICQPRHIFLICTVYIYIYLYLFNSIILFIYLPTYLSICLSIYLSIDLSIYLIVLIFSFYTYMNYLIYPFSRMRSKGSRFTLGVWGLRVCSLDVAFTSATVRNRSQPSAGVRAIPVWPCLWEVLQRWSFLGVADVSLLRFAWQAWHFVTFRRVLERVESRFVWQAQYFRDVFARCLAFFVAGAALWTCPSSFFVAGAAL